MRIVAMLLSPSLQLFVNQGSSSLRSALGTLSGKSRPLIHASCLALFVQRFNPSIVTVQRRYIVIAGKRP